MCILNTNIEENKGICFNYLNILASETIMETNTSLLYGFSYSSVMAYRLMLNMILRCENGKKVILVNDGWMELCKYQFVFSLILSSFYLGLQALFQMMTRSVIFISYILFIL
jgi:hypothetical protein